jgi:hypothetical protein
VRQGGYESRLQFGEPRSKIELARLPGHGGSERTAGGLIVKVPPVLGREG